MAEKSPVIPKNNDMDIVSPNLDAAKPSVENQMVKGNNFDIGNKVNAMITMNRVKTWFCGYVSNSRANPKGHQEFHVQFLNRKVKPRWFRTSHLHNCDHNPQLTTPHDSFVSSVKAPLREEHPRG